MIKRLAAIVALAWLAAGCDKPSPPGSAASPSASIPDGTLQQLVNSNGALVGYLYAPETPDILASFSNGSLVWRSDPERQASTQGQAQVFKETDRICIGFERKNLTMPTYGPERYLVCKAVQTIQHSNTLPRSQDFLLRPGTLFLEYRPPAGTGFAQIFYASVKR